MVFLCCFFFKLVLNLSYFLFWLIVLLLLQVIDASCALIVIVEHLEQMESMIQNPFQFFMMTMTMFKYHKKSLIVTNIGGHQFQDY
jgi:hypothetical protein